MSNTTKVKTLVWDVPEGRADSPFGPYVFEPFNRGGVDGMLEYPMVGDRAGAYEYVSDPDEMMAAAQADFERRVRACLAE